MWNQLFNKMIVVMMILITIIIIVLTGKHFALNPISASAYPTPIPNLPLVLSWSPVPWV